MLTQTYYGPGMFGLGADPQLPAIPMPTPPASEPSDRAAVIGTIAVLGIMLVAGVVKAVFYFKAEADAKSVAERLIDAKYGKKQ